MDRLTGTAGWNGPFTRFVWAGGLVAALAVVTGTAGCSDDSSGVSGSDGGLDAGPGGDGASNGSDGHASGDSTLPHPDGGSDARADGGGPDASVMPNCYHVCFTPSDCALGNSLHDADNYQCQGNRCRWLGCNNTTECVDTFMDNRYVCDTLPPSTFPACYRSCNVPADCSLGNALHDADNYRCTSNLCEWLGCNNTTECVDTFMDNRYACGTLPPLTMPSCYLSCNTPADCVLANILYDADNYQCNGNLCQWTGCNNTAECVAGFNDNDYVCE